MGYLSTRSLKLTTVALGVAVCAFASPMAVASPEMFQAQAPAAKAPPRPVAQPPALEPASIAALKRMGGHLVTLRSFEIAATISLEYVLDNNQKILVGGTSRYRVRRPDRLRIDLATDVVDRVFQYDGKDLIVTAPKEKYYARLEAKATVRETLAWAAQTFGIEVPLADLFDWGTPEASEAAIREGFRVGKARIGGVECEHWAFRQADIDWEIWIRTGDSPLPLKLSTVNTADPARPRYEAVLVWTESVEFPDDIFLQAPVADAKRIEFLPLAPGPRQRQ
jgi:hypothetical protein